MIGSIGTAGSARRMLEDHERAVARLRAYCGRANVEACGRRSCSYFDEEQGRCALLVFNVYERLGENALRWFATHRTTRAIEVEPADEDLAMRLATR
ncbi:MAG TPA: hypothetical protein VJ818_08785 [Actinomycetota bacterium]|nr:hypothetical protein [Actinomycetota bacterium]